MGLTAKDIKGLSPTTDLERFQSVLLEFIEELAKISTDHYMLKLKVEKLEKRLDETQASPD